MKCAGCKNTDHDFLFASNETLLGEIENLNFQLEKKNREMESLKREIKSLKVKAQMEELQKENYLRIIRYRGQTR